MSRPWEGISNLNHGYSQPSTVPVSQCHRRNPASTTLCDLKPSDGQILPYIKFKLHRTNKHK
jgi:hypothetical protein